MLQRFTPAHSSRVTPDAEPEPNRATRRAATVGDVSGYGHGENEATRAFHVRRRMFVLLEHVVLAPEGSTLSHAEWFNQLDLDPAAMDTAVRGYAYAGELYLYVGYDFAEPDLDSCRHLIDDLATQVGATGTLHLGLVPGTPGERYSPRTTTALRAWRGTS